MIFEADISGDAVFRLQNSIKVLVEKNYFAHFSTQPFHWTFIMISMKKCGEKKISMEMAAIFDFRALTKVHLTSKPLIQMQ